ncbi:MAG: OFA family MFS transporter [Acidobacteria bacterium]|nr:OFA family MFS transporter [Acidobacteriota bacterium]
MVKKRRFNRWLVVVGAVLIQLALGAIYAWPVFTPSLEAAGWSKAQTQIVFSAGLFFFAVLTVVSGRLMPRLGPRKLALAGGIVLGAGNILAGLVGGTNIGLLVLFIGVIGGSGIGLAYIVPIAVGMRWFPDKKGLITGLAVAGFGFGAMFWIKFAGTWGDLIEKVGLSQTFFFYGILFLAMVVVGGIWMVFPPDGWNPEGWSPPAPKRGQVAEGTHLKSRDMLRTPQFYMIFLTFAFSAGAGLMTIGLMKLFPRDALQSSGMTPEAAGAVAGTAMAFFFSLANGFGRIAWGYLSDRLGRKLSVVLMCSSQGILMMAFVKMAGMPSTLYLFSALIGFNFGGNFTLFPTLTADIFGARHIGQLYGWVFLAYGVGGILGPMLGGRLGDMGNFPLAFMICGALCFLAALLAAAVRPPRTAVE